MIKGHGDDIYTCRQPIKYNFSSNIYAMIDNADLKHYLSCSLDIINNYPEPEPFALETKLSGRLGISQSQVCVTNGATDAIYMLAKAFGNNSSSILIPTFSEYEDACTMNGHHVSRISSIEEVTDDMQTVWICNPNNPTGDVYRNDIIKNMVNGHPRTIFIIDQAYEQFTSEEVLTAKDAVQWTNVILIHSMTKEYAIPGLRIGYITACKEIIDKVNRYRTPWSVNSLAIIAGGYLIDRQKAYFDKKSYMDEAQWLRMEIDKLSDKIEALPTKTNFMLVRLLDAKASDLKEFLITKGILIRDASNFAGLDSRYFRIAAQSHQSNIILINALKEWLQRY